MKNKTLIGLLSLVFIVAGLTALFLLAKEPFQELNEFRNERVLSSDQSAVTPRREGEDVLRFLVWGGYDPPNLISDFEQEIEEKYQRKVTLQVKPSPMPISWIIW